ncbi:DgyrCDS6841 [Dimorphilus gyrociliatus]|uniref:DgyrCDS6841 n=1 Tax=Dimorphilus gyrociliatus TaxID=2664684 RepID=A0A7I8VP68_9ANNE|nr:DgyrCDS6841 [Dimorphilus gyrociliatus]
MATNSDVNSELDNFLNKVDELDDLMHGIRSSKLDDEDELNKLELNTIQQLTKFKSEKDKTRDNKSEINKTIINQKAFTDNPADIRDEFKAAVEKDALERSERRKKHIQEAKFYKEKGNTEFKNENYEKAVEYYTKGIDLVKDMIVLYTNRAQAYIKLSEYEKALKDCDLALRLDDKYLKAYLHKGKAYSALGKFDEALNSYKTAISCDPKKQNVVSLIQGYISEVQLKKNQANSSGDRKEIQLKTECVVDVLDTLFINGTEAVHVHGGLRILQNILYIPDAPIIFKSNGGLRLSSEHDLIVRCLESEPTKLTKDELQVCSSVYACYAAACINDDEHKRVIFLENEKLAAQTQKFLDALLEKAKTLHVDILAFIRVVTCIPIGVDAFATKFDACRFVKSCVDLQSFYEKKLPKLGNDIVAIFFELFKCRKFRDKMVSQINGISDIFADFMRKNSKINNIRLLSTFLTGLTSLARDQRLRKLLSERTLFWTSIFDVLERVINPLASSDKPEFSVQRDCMLLLNCLCYENSEIMKSKSIGKICSAIYPLLKAEEHQLQQTTLHTYSTILTGCKDIAIEMIKWGFVEYLIELMTDGEKFNGNCLTRCLLACTRADQSTCKMLTSWLPALKSLINLLDLEDEKAAGNAALVLTDLLNHDKNICNTLKATDIIRRLLIMCKDANCQKVRVNCAIFLSKIVTTDEELKIKLRELDGIGILHNMLKSVRLDAKIVLNNKDGATVAEHPHFGIFLYIRQNLKKMELDSPPPSDNHNKSVSERIDSIRALRRKVDVLNSSIQDKIGDLSIVNTEAEQFENHALSSYDYIRETNVDADQVFDCKEFGTKFRSHVRSIYGENGLLENGGISEMGWKKIGESIGKYYKLFSGKKSFAGCLGDIPPEKKRQSRSQIRRKDKELMMLSQPGEKAVGSEKKEETSALVLHVLKCLRHNYRTKKRAIGFYEFVVDPLSFGRTLENIFYLSFLIRDRHVRMFLNADQLPVIKPVSEEERSKFAEVAEIDSLSTLFTVTHEDWTKIVEKLGMEHRSLISRPKC